MPDTKPSPTWEIVHLFPNQGEWTQADFFALQGNRLVELVDGTLEVLPVPTWLHQLIVRFLCRELETASQGLGVVLTAPLPVVLFEKTIREPDVMFFSSGSEPRDPCSYPTTVDLAMEVVSDGPQASSRDYVAKRRDYERAGVKEYWIVDPQEGKITVLALDGTSYRVHGEFRSGASASSPLLPSLNISVDAILELKRKGRAL